MAQREPRRIVIPSKEELLKAAHRRVSLPPGEMWLDYQDDVDTLYISLKEKTQPTHSESDIDDLVVFDYEGEELVGIEIMDITGQSEIRQSSLSGLRGVTEPRAVASGC
jgi:uncharacterized protein YuzE